MFRNILSVLILQGSNYILPLITLPYLTRVLGIENFGLYGYVFAVVQYCIIVIDFGFNLSATKKISDSRGNKNQMDVVFTNTIAAKFVLFFVSLISLFLFIIFSDEKLIFVLYAIPMMLGSVLFPLWYFQGIENMRVVAIISIVSKLLTLPGIFLMVKSSYDIKYAIFIQSSSLLLLGLLSLLYIHSIDYVRFKISHVSNSNIKTSLSDSFPIFIASVSISMYTISSVIILNYFSEVKEVSLFSAAERLKNAILSAMLVLGNVFFPRVNLLLNESKLKAYKLIKLISLYQSIFCVAIFLIFIVYSNEIAIFVFGHEFSNTSQLLIIFSPLYIVVMQSTVLGNYILLPLGYKKTYSLLPIFTMCLHLPVCIYLSKHYGAKGAAFSILVSECFSFLTLLYVIKKYNIIKKLKN